jgi:hypothetical protein
VAAARRPPMRLDRIMPWSGQLFSPTKKAEDATRSKGAAKPPQGDAGVSGVQPEAISGRDPRPPDDDTPSEGLNIVV